MIPECGILPEALKSVITDIGEYYLVKNLSLHELVTHEFINAFVKKGKGELKIHTMNRNETKGLASAFWCSKKYL